MKNKSLIKQFTLACCALLAVTVTGRAQLGGSDSGSTAPAPGPYDISQLLTTGDTIALPDSSGLNQFYDNTTGGTGYVGSSFTTGGNSAGYVMNSLSLKFGGGGGTGNPGYSGGNDVTLTPGWIITIYQLSGTGNTTATPVATNTAGTLTGTANTGGDWVNLTGFNLTLLANTHYAWTIFQPSGYDDLGYATGSPYSGGAICRIPPAGGTVTYFPADNDSATFNVGLSQIPNPLGGADLGSTAPTLGANDISQLLTTGDTIALPDTAINQFYDNTSGGAGYVGSSFLTGGNSSGYLLNSLALKFGGGGSVGFAGGNDVTLTPGWIFTIFQLSGTSNTIATPLATNTVVGTIAGTGNTGADWVNLTGFNLALSANTTYAWTIYQPNGYDDLGYATGTPYPNGALCRIPPGGGTVTYYPADADSATFDIGLSLKGFPGVGLPTATQNPVYALSPITLSDTATGPGTVTYQWQTNTDLTGATNGTWVNVPGATALSLPVTPANLNPGGADYIIDYQFIASNLAGTATSPPLALVVHAATVPVINTDTAPASYVSFVGGAVTFSASFVGTTPLTNDWQANTNGSFVDLAGETNGTLTLNNVQLSASGTYQLLEKNSQGQTHSTPATLTVIAAPAAPTSSEKEAYEIYTNGTYAYWRLNETGNPSTSPFPLQAYDYSGNGFDATYGNLVTTSNTGPIPPAFPGFLSSELAAGTAVSSAGAFLTVPPLNLNTNTVTFVAWINPSSAQPPSTGLLFNRSGSDAAGFGFNIAQNPNGNLMAELGYTWNSNSSATWGSHSGLFPPINVWSFVAFVITPTNETTYLAYVDTTVTPNTTNFLQSSVTLAHVAEAFSTASDLGSDPQSLNRTFNGLITEAALYNKSLSQQAILGLFLTGIGSGPIPPTPPATLASQSIYAGAQVQYNGTAGGSPTITYQWKSAVIGSGIFTNIPNGGNVLGATSPLLTINGATIANALDYEVVAANSVGTNTSGVAALSVTAVPPGGQWTVNFQSTNATASDGFVGLDSYTGNGVLGTGTYWNSIGDPQGAFTGGTYTSVTDFRDDGVTHSGIYATCNGGGFSSEASPSPASSITTLLGQYVNEYTPLAADGGGLILHGVPDGIYNFVIYDIDGGFSDRGEIINVYATNGTQTGTTLNAQDAYFSPNDNSLLFTNVQVAGGTLLVDITPNPAAHGGGNTEADFNGAQLQLLSYSSTVSNVEISSTYDSTNGTATGTLHGAANGTLTLNWPEGLLQTATNLAGPWTTIIAPPPFIMNTGTNAAQFFRLKVH